MYVYETHLHTYPASSCAKSSPEEQARAYKRRGYTGIIVTDHFVNGSSGCPSRFPWNKKMEFLFSGYEKAKKAGDKCGLDVFFGLEYSINGADILTYGLSLDFLRANPGMERLEIEEYSALVRGGGGYLAQAHPFRAGYSWIPEPRPVDPRFIDGVEVYNASDSDDTNKQAFEFARRHNLPMQAGSDAHEADAPYAGGIALKKKAENIFDIIEAIKSERVELVLPREAGALQGGGLPQSH